MLRAPGLLTKLPKLLFQQSFRSGASFWIIINQVEMNVRSSSNTLPYLAYAIEWRFNAPQHHLRLAIIKVLRRELV